MWGVECVGCVDCGGGGVCGGVESEGVWSVGGCVGALHSQQ